MKCDIITLCAGAHEDERAQLSIDRAFTRIGFKKLPVRWECVFVARVNLTSEEEGGHSASLTITDPDGLDVVSKTEPRVISRMLIDESFGHLVFMAPLEWVVATYGEYTIRLRVDSNEYLTEFHVKRYREDGRVSYR